MFYFLLFNVFPFLLVLDLFDKGAVLSQIIENTHTLLFDDIISQNEQGDNQTCEIIFKNHSKLSCLALGVSVGVEGSASWDWHKIKAGFSRINPGHYLRFDVDVSASTTVYISVITEDGIVVADAIPKRADLSVIIGQNAQLYDTNYGSVWKDTSGTYHSGRKRRSVADGIYSNKQLSPLSCNNEIIFTTVFIFHFV